MRESCTCFKPGALRKFCISPFPFSLTFFFTLVLTVITNFSMSRPVPATLISDLMLPELERQLAEDDSLWPNVKGLFIITVTKKRKPAATW